FEQALRARADSDPERIAVRIGYDEGLAHRLEGGGDAFIMPSRFEPCGLNQLYSLKYGTIPIVHHVGGLADTVIPMTADTLKDGSATGIVMNHLDVNAILWSIDKFSDLFRRPDDLARMRQQAMAQQYDWGASARSYIDLYREISPAVPKK
ncbi:MAG TPA: starch synthase, partial [Guyparkeria sp.]|nr:starch synthase [Guyparkeria sp.]